MNILGIYSGICLRRVIRRWPAIIFADRRTDRVMGRIIFLVVSINTIKEDKGSGVPKGTRWENIYVVLFIQPNIIKSNHIGSARVKVIIMWLVEVKI